MFNAEVWNQYGTFCFEVKICLFWYHYVTEINDFEVFLTHLSLSNLGPGTSILYMNGDKLALLMGCFFVENRVFARGLRVQKYTLKRYKRAFK
tara:strand:- start:396 stop:674 length:279 start_codon:yes stop_codon:yes gene_type:complete